MSDKKEEEDNDCINDLTKQVRSLVIEVKALKQIIEGQEKEKKKIATRRPQEVSPCTLKIGDRVRILNQVKKPKNWDDAHHLWVQSEARRATVTQTSGEKIFFRTDNDIYTWRSAKNVVLIPE